MTKTCQVKGCNNKTKQGLRFYTLPQGVRNEERRREWLRHMQIAWEEAEKRTIRLCEVHFDSTEFEQHRKDDQKRLKPNAVPTIFPGRVIKRRKPPHPRGRYNVLPKVSPKDHDHPYAPHKCGVPDEDINLDSDPEQDVTEVAEKEANRNDPVVPVPVSLQQVAVLHPVCNVHEAITAKVDPKLQETYGTRPFPILPSPTVQLFRAVPVAPFPPPEKARPVYEMMSPVDMLKRKCSLLRRKVSKLEQDKKNITANLERFLNQDQIRSLAMKSNRGIQWSVETLQSAAELFLVCGSKGYELLLKKGYPFPSRRTLSRLHARSADTEELHLLEISPGNLYNLLPDNEENVTVIEEECDEYNKDDQDNHLCSEQFTKCTTEFVLLEC